VIAQRYGASKTYAAFFALATVGNLLVGLSVLAGQESAFSVLMGGRLLMGLAYEAVDMLPIGFMAPRFEDSWSTTVGMLNGINRLGSVLNFLLEPVLYRTGLAPHRPRAVLCGATDGWPVAHSCVRPSCIQGG